MFFQVARRLGIGEVLLLCTATHCFSGSEKGHQSSACGKLVNYSG
jgi:hypothetical protein